MGCGNTKPSDIIQSQKQHNSAISNNTVNKAQSDGSSPSKVANSQTKADDILGISTKADMAIDFSKLSMTDMIGNAQVIVSAIIFLIESNLSKNQMLKAVLRRMQSLEPCFQELQKKNSKLSKDLVINLICIVNKIKDACERILADKKTLWEKFKNVVTAKAQLLEISELNELLSKAQQDLSIPLQLEESNKIDKMFNYLKEVTEKGLTTCGSIDEKSILPLAKKFLSNEEAFIFWFDCLPNKYCISQKKFENIFNDYLEGFKEVKLKPNELKKIITMIKGPDAKEEDEINARLVNQFFESLPLDVHWNNLGVIEKQVEIEQKKRETEIQQIREQAEKTLDDKVKKIESQSTDEEKSLEKNNSFIRYLVKQAWIQTKQRKNDILFRNIFINAKKGDIQGFGGDKKSNFKLNGEIETQGKLKMELSYDNGTKTEIEGKIIIEETVISIQGKFKGGKIKIILDLEYWFGYYEQDGDQTDMQTFLKIVGKNVSGISYDEVGLALWKGTLTTTDLNMKKSYVLKHDVKYSGKIKKKGTSTEIKGKWNIKELEDLFFLSHSEGGEEEDCEENVEEEGNKSDFNKCANGHDLKWSKDGTNYNTEEYGCDNCGRDCKIAVGRWNCGKCQYDICPKCRAMPEKDQKSCTKGHSLIWSNSQGNYPAPSYCCDACGRQGGTSKGRWNCSNCSFDLCSKCRIKN